MGRKLATVGFYQELGYPNSRDGSAVAALAVRRAEPDKARLLDYLRSGVNLFEEMRFVYDPLCPTRRIGTAAAVTDGRWVWLLPLAYLVERYDLELPGEFLAHVRAHEYAIPDRSALVNLGDNSFEVDTGDGPGQEWT